MSFTSEFEALYNEKQKEKAQKAQSMIGLFNAYSQELAAKQATPTDGIEIFQDPESDNIIKIILGTAGDAAVNVGKGVTRFSEGIADYILYGIGDAAKLFGYTDADLRDFRRRTAASTTDQWFGGVDNYLDQHSVLGRTSDAILEGAGQVAAIVGLGGFGAGAGLGTAGTTALTTGASFVSGAGSGRGEAYQGGATDEESRTYGTISGAADAITELIFGGLGKSVKAVGIGKGLTSADDMLAKTLGNKVTKVLSKVISNEKVLRSIGNTAELGVKMSAEGAEEVLAGLAQAVGKKVTYMSEEDLGKIIQDENLLEQFLVGAATSGIMQGGDLHRANKTGTDLVTGFTRNEQAVIDKEVENRLAKEREGGKKLSGKDKSRIYEEVVRDMERGYISTETIEEVLGKGNSVSNRRLTSDDLSDYMRVGERKHVRDAKQHIVDGGESPILTKPSEIFDFIRNALHGKVKDVVKAYGRVNDRLANAVKDATNGEVSIDNYYLELDANRIAHLNDHVGQDKDVRNIPLTEEQVGQIPEYVDNFDDLIDVIRRKDGSVRLMLGKKINGHSIIVETVSKGRNALHPVTAYQIDTKDYINNYKTRAIDRSSTSRPANADTVDISRPAIAPVNNSISKTAQDVKSAEERSRYVRELVKNDRLGESYREQTRKGEKFQADVSKYSEAQQRTVQNAIDSGVLNNTNRSHEFVDLIAKISADKGIPFDFADNAKLKQSGFALDGVLVNGFVNENGVTINIQSAKALNRVVGHEITHVLEGTELYNALQSAVTEYAKGKKEYNRRLKELTKLYEGKNANVEQELVADLVGDYLFTDADFIKHLSTEHRNLAQKIYDEIKYLCKIVTAGTKEARQLEKVKKAFADAYRAETKNPTEEGEVKYSLENEKKKRYNKRSTYNETETLFLRWANGSTPVGEVKKFVRQGELRYYEKTENGCVELNNSQYSERSGIDGENTYRRAEREIGEAHDHDGSAQRGLSGGFGSDRNSGGNAAVFGQTVRKELRHDTAGGTSSSTGYGHRNDIEQTEYSTEASDNSGASSLITFSNDYATVRNFMKDGDDNRAETKNPTADGEVKYSIVNLDTGKSYVQASRQVIHGSSVSEWRSQISGFFNRALKNGPIEIETIEGDMLTISKNTAEKARSKTATENGVSRELTDKEFLVKLHAEAHIDELAEISHKSKRPPVPDGKNHNFAKDGFTYRTVYFQDFDGAYYRITLSVGENNGISTVYNVGKIKADDIPDGKVISTIGSKADMSSTKFSISSEGENVNTKFSLTTDERKAQQLAIILESNPMWDDYHTGIRSVKDIRTWEEVLELDDEREGQFVWGDFSREDAENALKNNSVTVYSSHPISNGTFVSTSYTQAWEYAGGNKNSKVYSKEVPLDDVAWINGDEGEYAKLDDGQGTTYSLSKKDFSIAPPVGADVRGQDIGYDIAPPIPESVLRASGVLTNDEVGIREQLRNNQGKLNTMKPVADIQVPADYSSMDVAGKKQSVIEKLRPTGYKVKRKGFGVINFAKKQLKAAFNYFDIGSTEEMVFEALPRVLEKGMQIYVHGEHKGRGYGTVTIAAPITVNGVRGNMAVVVKQTTDNYYKVHRVLAPDGTMLILPEMTNEAESTPTGESPQSGSLAMSKDSASNNSISKTAQDVKSAEERSRYVRELVKNDRLGESYAEQTRKGEKFQADVSKYSEAQRKTVQNAIDSGILNNTNRSHEFVDLIAKISADKGISFDFADNAKLKESGFALDGVLVNGFVNENGVTINIQSPKALNRVVGHEITHVLEGTQLYDALQSAVTEYAKGKKEYNRRLKELTKLYEGKNANVEQELVADLVGDYLFTDADFIKHLSTEHRNLAQKIYDEIKYLCKIVTAGTKEARQLEKVKKAFADAYRAETKNPTADGGVKYSLGQYSDAQKENWKNSKKIVIYENDAQLLQFVRASIANKDAANKMYFGIISGDLAKRIKADTGLDFNGKNAVLRAMNVRKILLHDHGNVESEKLRGQVAVTETDFLAIKDIFGDPDTIKPEPQGYNGKPAATFEKVIGDKKYTMFVVDSGGSLDIFVQTMYIHKQKGSIANVANAKALTSTPKATVGTAPTTNVQQNNPVVKQQNSLSKKDFSIAPPVGADVHGWDIGYDIAPPIPESVLRASGAGRGPLDVNDPNYAPTTPSDESGIREQLRNSQDTLNAMVPVANITTPSSFAEMDLEEKKNWVIEKLRPTGYTVERKGFGIIDFAQKKLRAAFNYFKKGSAEEAAFEAMPYVLKKGVEISSRENHKGRKYSTVTFAAPVTINGQRGNMAVVVRQTEGNQYKVHRILSPDGSVFDLLEIQTEAESSTTRGVADIGSLASSKDSASINSIPESGGDVKGYSIAPPVNMDKSVGAALLGIDPVSHLQYEYGSLPEGENAVREDSLPKSTNGTDRVSLTARTVKGAQATPDALVDLLDKTVVEGGLSYIPLSNDATVQRAYDRIKDLGWERALKAWQKKVYKGEVSAEITATGALLLNNAANAGNRELWREILFDYQQMSTNAGQAVQALRILKSLAPQDKLYMIKTSIDQMNEDNGYDVEVDEELLHEWDEAETDAERDEVLDEIMQNVADQIPATFMEKFTALRYVNMLGNLRTQVRNVAGNLSMKGVRSIHNTIATGLEAIVNTVSGGKTGRTRSVTVSQEQKNAAKNDFEKLKSVILDGGKYSDSVDASTEFAKGVQEKRRIFKGKIMEGYRKATNWAMEQGDLIFARDAYARALSGYLKANGITETDYSKIDTKVLEDARLFAIKEAQEATFRDTNALSGWISKISRRRDTHKVGKLISEGVMPFRKTPANVLIRAEEYSPLGVINSVYYSVKALQKETDVTATQVINSWAKSLTGTGLFALGMLLQSVGCLAGGADDDESKDKFDSLNGWQNYAIVLPDGTNLTIDFLTPTAMPMLMGAELSQLMADDGFELKDLESALTSITEPMVQMSMLQGINDTLDNVKYSDNSLMQIAINSGLSYVTQGLTNTLLGQIERSFEDSRTTTYVDKDSAIPDWLQRTIGKTSAKMPGLDYNQIPYINAWGEEEEYGNVASNLAYNMLSPSYVDKGEEDAVSKELLRLNEVQSENVFPSTPEESLSFTDVNNESHKNYQLSAEEYVALAKTQGQKQRELVEAAISAKEYGLLSDTEKATVIKNIYKYAKEYARGEVIEGYADDYGCFSTKWMSEIYGDVAEEIIWHTIDQRD